MRPYGQQRVGYGDDGKNGRARVKRQPVPDDVSREELERELASLPPTRSDLECDCDQIWMKPSAGHHESCASRLRAMLSPSTGEEK